MTHFVEGEDRTQSTLFPERLDEYIGEDNPVRVIYVPKPLTSSGRKTGQFTKQDFVYEPERDQYRCPAGEALTWRSEFLHRLGHNRSYTVRAHKRARSRTTTVGAIRPSGWCPGAVTRTFLNNASAFGAIRGVKEYYRLGGKQQVKGEANHDHPTNAR
jgi:hypothetical protein